jgi:hypothetical protein
VAQIHLWQLDRPAPGDYYHYYLKYVKEGLGVGFAYMERSFMYSGAKCYLQARLDGTHAIINNNNNEHTCAGQTE